MGVFDWFKRAAAGSQPPAEPQPADGADGKSAELGGLNFMTAIEAHLKWKSRLEDYIQGTGKEQLDAVVVSRDDQCPLGKWIHGQGGQLFGYSETFADMRGFHAEFHRCASQVIKAAQGGTKDEALRMLHHGDYVRTSERVKMSLARLFVLVSEGRAAIDAHVKWKARLLDFVQGAGGEALTPEAVAADDHCTLGKWLHGPGRERFGHLTAFEDARKKHAVFHRQAGEVVRLAAAGQRDEALALVEDGTYARASDDVTTALVGLFKLEAQNA